METINLRFKIITPLFIGSGIELTPLDYFTSFENNKNLLNVVDFGQVISRLLEIKGSRESMSFILQYLDQKIKGKTQFYGNLKDLVESFTRKFGGDTKQILRTSIIYSFPIENYVNDLKNVIEMPILTHNYEPYIPGSSLKGAIKTALCYENFKGKITSEYLIERLKKEIERMFKSRKGSISKEISNKVKIDPKEQPNFMVRDVKIKEAKFALYRINRLGMRKKSSKLNYALFIDSGFFEVEIKLIDNSLNKSSLIEQIKIFYQDVIKKNKSKWKDSIPFDWYKENKTYLQLGKFGNYFTKTLGVLWLESSMYPKTIAYIKKGNNFVQPGWLEVEKC